MSPTHICAGVNTSVAAAGGANTFKIVCAAGTVRLGSESLKLKFERRQRMVGRSMVAVCR